jgi:hypothetical protein
LRNLIERSCVISSSLSPHRIQDKRICPEASNAERCRGENYVF